MTARLKTYIVEDNTTIRDNLVSALEELAGVSAIGYAETEADAREWLGTHRDDWELAIVDLFLREGNGLGVLQECQARQAAQKVVVLTNYATDEIKTRCARLGADAVFDKSNEIDGLVDFCLRMAAARGTSAINRSACS